MTSEARASTALFEGEGTGLVLGCLIGESEERETWTAESLRAVFSQAEKRPDETSAVLRFGQHARSREWPGACGPRQTL